MLLVCYFCDKQFIVDYIFCDIVWWLFFRLFLPVSIFFLVIFHLSIIAFLIVIFVIVALWFFFSRSLPIVFIGMSRFVAVMKFWYVCIFFMPEVVSLVSAFTASCIGTLVLGLYLEGFFIFYWSSWTWLFVRSVKFHQNIVTDHLNI